MVKMFFQMSYIQFDLDYELLAAVLNTSKFLTILPSFLKNISFAILKNIAFAIDKWKRQLNFGKIQIPCIFLLLLNLEERCSQTKIATKIMFFILNYLSNVSQQIFKIVKNYFYRYTELFLYGFKSKLPKTAIQTVTKRKH